MSAIKPKIVTEAEWLDARLSLLEKEKAFNQRRDELTRERQALPWVRVTQPYLFDGAQGKESLSDLFDGRSQLIVYHFMYHESWAEGCVSCSYWADNFNGIIVHLNARDVSMVAISSAPYEQISSYKERLGWTFKWMSSRNGEFNDNYQVSFNDSNRINGEVHYNYKLQNFPSDEAPGVSVFKKNEQGDIFHTYSTYSRGIDMLNGAYHYLDIVPDGRNESDLPWSMAWLARNDAYGS